MIESDRPGFVGGTDYPKFVSVTSKEGHFYGMEATGQLYVFEQNEHKCFWRKLPGYEYGVPKFPVYDTTLKQDLEDKLTLPSMESGMLYNEGRDSPPIVMTREAPKPIVGPSFEIRDIVKIERSATVAPLIDQIIDHVRSRYDADSNVLAKAVELAVYKGIELGEEVVDDSLDKQRQEFLSKDWDLMQHALYLISLVEQGAGGNLTYKEMAMSSINRAKEALSKLNMKQPLRKK